MLLRGTGLFGLRPANHIKTLHHHDYCTKWLCSVLRLEMVHRSGAARNAILDIEVIVEIQSYDLLIFANVPAEYKALHQSGMF